MKDEVNTNSPADAQIRELREEVELLRQELEVTTASEARLRMIIDKIPTFAWSGLPDGSKEFFSQRWLDYTGLTPDKALGWGWKAAIHPDDLENVVKQLKVLEMAEIPGVIEARLRRYDGVYHWFLFRMEPFKDEYGRLVKWYGTSTDVDDQRRAESKLQQSERLLAEGQRLTKTGSWELDFQTGETDWSVETCRIFGFPAPPPSPNYSQFLARVSPQDRDSVDRALRESFESGEPRPLEYRFMLPDGTEKDIKTISQPISDGSGKVRLVGTIMDVTEQKAIQETLQASEIFARGQLAALTRTLEHLSGEPNPEKIVEHVLRTITEQLNAHSCSVWRKVDSTGAMEFDCAFEDGKLLTPASIQVASINPILPLTGPKGSAEPTFWEDIRDCPRNAWRDYLIEKGVTTALFLPTGIAGRVEGVLSIRFPEKRILCVGELELAKALAVQVMLAMQLRRLSQKSREAALAAERNRLARDIHDTLAQGFTGVIIQLEAAKGAAAKGGLEGASAHIDRASKLARASLEEARRSVRALRPQALRDGSLCVALAQLLKNMSEGTALEAKFQFEGDIRLVPEDWEEDLLRITQESLANTIKHAQAKNFHAKLMLNPHKIELQITDDGTGFAPRPDCDGFGLIGMKERVDRMGGDFVLASQSGWGTKISVILADPEKAKENAK